MKTVLFSSLIGDINAEFAFVNNLDATTDPAITDDSSSGYSAGSTWVNITSSRVWTCTDATAGAAVWVASGQTAGNLIAPAASTPTGAGGTALVRGGTGGTTSGAGGPAQVTGGAATAGNSAGGAAPVTGGVGSGNAAGGVGSVTGGQGGATGAGGPANVTGGAGGATSGNGGPANVTGGAATAGNGNGGSVVLTGGAKNGTGIAGGIRTEGLAIQTQGAPAAKTVSATLTAAEVLTGIITVNQAGAASSALQLPTGTNLQAALPADFADNDSFDFSVINTSTVDAEDASLTTNTGWTLVGNMDIPAYSAAGSLNSSGLFRARRTASNTFTLYRIG